MIHNTKKGRTPFKSKRYGKTRRVQRGGALVKDADGNTIGEYDDETRLGRAVYPGVGVYEGHFNENGVPHGGGTLTYEDGAVYKGEWVNDMPRGHGVMTFASGNVYDGGWVDNEMSGRGVMTFPSGRVYDGEWSNSACNGHGKMTYADESESVYEGNWLDNLKHGEGKMTYNGRVYKGNWRNDERNGEGELTYPDGQKYKGEWLNDKMNGQGKMTYADDERVYEGNWLDNKRHGQGKLTYPDGEKYEGAWDNNQLNGQGKMTYANGDMYVGNWRNNERHGEGTMIYANGDVYKGDFHDDKRQGHGVMTSANGEVNEGPWFNDERVNYNVSIARTTNEFMTMCLTATKTEVECMNSTCPICMDEFIDEGKLLWPVMFHKTVKNDGTEIWSCPVHLKEQMKVGTKCSNCRTELFLTKEQKKPQAATKLQSVIRGRQTRKKIRRANEYEISRREFHDWYVKDKAASTIQRFFSRKRKGGKMNKNSLRKTRRNRK